MGVKLSICQFTEEKFLLRDRILHLIDFNPQDSGSRSDSPISDSHTISEPSPVSFMSEGYNTASAASATTTTASDSGVIDGGGGGPLTMHTSPKPERKRPTLDREERPRETLIRKFSPQAYKFYMEQRIENVIKEYHDRRNRMMRLEKELLEHNQGPELSRQMRQMLQSKETEYLRMRRAKLDKKHFKKIKKIGEGAFGNVFLVRSNAGVGTRRGVLYAMKTLKKNKVIQKNQMAHVIAERDALREADNEWIVKLFYSFQVLIKVFTVLHQSPFIQYICTL